jgi:hypothetical protein
MSERIEGDEAKTQHLLHGALPDGLPEKVKREIVLQLMHELDETEPPADAAETRAVSRKLGQKGYYVVVRGDVDYLDTVMKAAPDLLAKEYWKVLPDLVKLLFKYRRVGVDVSSNQGIVLQAMNEDAPQDGWTVGELWAKTVLRFEHLLTEAQVTEELAALLAAQTREGKPRPLVTCAGERWRLIPGVVG